MEDDVGLILAERQQLTLSWSSFCLRELEASRRVGTPWPAVCRIALEQPILWPAIERSSEPW